jgi:hypothetical protein
LQDLNISINEWAVVFFLAEIESGVIGRSHFGRSFHRGCPFWCLFEGWDEGGSCLKLISNLKFGKWDVSEAGVYWKDGIDVQLIFVFVKISVNFICSGRQEGGG